MKHRIAFFLITACFTFVFSGMCIAQQSSILANLHPRPKVSYFRSAGTFVITPATPILISDTSSAQALDYLERMLQQTLGYTLAPFRGNFMEGVAGAIYLGEAGSYPALDSALAASLASGETMPPAEGYVMDVSQHGILLTGTDPNGTFNSISTFAQLLQNSALPMVHINDWPDYPIRWVFSGHNLIEQSQVAALETIEDTMAAHKLNGLQQNDFKNNIYSVFEGSYPQYFYNVDSLQAYSAKSNVEIIPGVFPFGWSEGILFHDPDIAEGIPTTTSYLIQSDTGIVLTDPNMILPNGGFENISNGQFTGWSYYDGPNQSMFVDSTTVHSGKYSARCTNFTAGNPAGDARFIRSLNCKPFHGYHMSVWINTQNFQGEEVQLLAIGYNGAQSTSLTYTAFPVPSTSNGWNQYNVVFNTLTYDSLYVYCGVWGGSAGTIWFDDFVVEDAGMTNVLRPRAEIPAVSEAGKSSNCVEGKDYAPIIDSVMEQNEGSYPWHTSPRFTVLPGSAIKNGDTVQVHFIRPNPVENDGTGDGSTMVCVSEDTLYSIIQNQLSLVDAQYHSNKYFMSHDEIREMNWDTACTSRHVSPAVELADNVKKADSIIQEVHPGAERFDWSDMFDSLHNAHNNYYLVNGDLSGDWNLIPKDFTIVNWNGGNMSQSLNFFSKLGFSQITSPYYDVPNTINMRDWRLAMDTIPNMRGMMYTTWANDYSFLTPFADYVWSAGPMIVHIPVRVIDTFGYPMNLGADVFSDPYLPSDSITAVTATVIYYPDSEVKIPRDTITVPFQRVSSNHYTGSVVPRGPWMYCIHAVNTEHLVRTTPFYEGAWAEPEKVSAGDDLPMRYSLYPDPAVNSVSLITGTLGTYSIAMIDALGRTILTQTVTNNSTVDVSQWPIGTYSCILKNGNTIQTKHFEIIR